MLDKLINLVRQHAGDAVINNPAIPNEKNNEAVNDAGTSIMGTLQNALASGRIKDVLGYFQHKGGDTDPIVKEATGNYAKDLQTRLGVDPGAAQDVANKVVPQTMNDLANRTADPSDNSFDIQDIFNSLSGGKTGGMDIKALLQRFGAGNLDKDGDGDVDLQDLKNMFGGSNAGGLMDKVKGMFN